MLLRAELNCLSWQDLFDVRQAYSAVEYHEARVVNLNRDGLIPYLMVVSFLKILIFALIFGGENRLYIYQVWIQCHTKVYWVAAVLQLCPKQGCVEAS